MKKILILVIGAAIMLGAGAYAQMGDMDTCPMCKGRGMVEKGMMHPRMGMQGAEMQGQKMGQMQKQMMQGRMAQGMQQNRMSAAGPMMGGREMVATSDGGVVLIIGNKMYKYDKDLKLKGEAEIKIDMEAMKKAQEEMKKMREEMMGKGPAPGKKMKNTFGETPSMKKHN